MNNHSTGTLYFYQGDRLITVKEGQNHHTVLRNDGQPLAELSNAPKASQSTLITSDAQGSVLSSRANQSIAQTAYTPYGYSPDSNRAMTLLAFNGEHRDPAGLYLLGNGYRAYDAVLLRFHSPDNQSPFGIGGINRYGFALGDPINGSDPTGHFTVFSKFRNFGGKRLAVKNLPGKAFYAPDPSDDTKKILTILAHGRPGAIGNTHEMSADRLFSLLERSGVPIKGEKTHIISCFSGAPAENGKSFISELATLTGAPSVGYQAAVSSYQFKNNIVNFNIRVLEKASTYRQWLNKNSAKSIRTTANPPLVHSTTQVRDSRGRQRLAKPDINNSDMLY